MDFAFAFTKPTVSCNGQGIHHPCSIPVQDSQFVIGSLRLTLASQQKILTHVCSPNCAGTDCWSPPVALEILKTLPKWAPILMGFDCCTCIPQGFAPVEHKITDKGLRTCGMTQKFSRTAIQKLMHATKAVMKIKCLA